MSGVYRSVSQAMIVRHFLNWSRTASVTERADATSALARAYLEAEFTAGERAAAEGALIALLDDPAPMVRAALAQALAPSEFTPPTIVHTLAADLPEVAGWMLEHSPLLVDADLVEAVAVGQSNCQVAIASRVKLSAAVAAARSMPRPSPRAAPPAPAARLAIAKPRSKRAVAEPGRPERPPEG